MKATWTVCSMLIASLFGGVASNLLLMNHVEAQAPAEVVTTSQLNLVDGGGRLRGILSGSDERGLASLAFYDETGQVRGVFGIEADGSPVMRLYDAGGQTGLVATTQGDDALIVVGEDGGRQGLFGLVQGAPIVSLGDGTRSRMQLHLNTAGLPRLALSDSTGEQSAALSVGSDDMPQLMLSAGGRSRAVFGVVQDATVLNLLDATQPRLVVGVAENGRPSVSFLGENGEIVRELP